MYKDVDVNPEVMDKLPEPSGYKVLIAALKANEKQGSVYIPDEVRHREDGASIIGYVLKIGPDAYTGDKFPSGPYCKPGDFVLYRSYSGTKFEVDGMEFRMINDDTVEGVVSDPRGYKRSW